MKKKPAPPTDANVIQDLVAQLLKHAALPTECAEIMDMKVDNVRNYCRRGMFEGATRFGNEWLIPRTTIEQYLKTSRGKPGRRSAEETADET
jgi:hypothetical protein